MRRIYCICMKYEAPSNIYKQCILLLHCTLHRLTKCQSWTLAKDLWQKEKEFKCESHWYFHRHSYIYVCIHRSTHFKWIVSQNNKNDDSNIVVCIIVLFLSFESRNPYRHIIISFINQINIMLLRLKTVTTDNRSMAKNAMLCINSSDWIQKYFKNDLVEALGSFNRRLLWLSMDFIIYKRLQNVKNIIQINITSSFLTPSRPTSTLGFGENGFYLFYINYSQV